MYRAIKTYCESGNASGLFLMDMPTGFGKTYSVLKYIFDACQQEENKERRYFFITPLKKNLPIEELKQLFQETGNLTLFNEKVLFIDSTTDSILNNYTRSLIKNIPYDISKSDEFQSFQQEVEFLQKQRSSSDTQLRQMSISIEKDFRERTEPAFRRMISAILSREFSSVKDRLSAIKTDNAWKWVGVLYPSVFTQDKQIYFMSMDKFLARNVVIVEPSYQLYNNKLLDNAIIFIDEFDSTKETLLHNIIQNGLRDKIDFIELFRSIYAAMETNAFPAVLTVSSEQRKKSKYNSQSLDQVLEDTRTMAKEIYAKYSLQFSHRTAVDAEDLQRDFLFQDHQFHSIHGKYITTVSDKRARINAIHFTPEKPVSETQNIQVMLGKLRGFIQWFQGMVNILAINYRQFKNEQRKDGEDEFTQEQAIRTVLSLFHLSSYETDYLTTQVMLASRKSKNEQIADSTFDRSVYENGFRYYCFENDSMHDMQSRIMMCAFQNTPEKLLLRICERAKVIGISATATVPTVIGNYDLDYLRGKMQGAFYTLPDEEHIRLEKSFIDSQIGYRNIQIHTELIGVENYSRQTWIDILHNSELADEVYDRLDREVAETNQNTYNKERYVRIAKAYASFLQHSDIQSMLCLLTKHPAKNDKYLNTDLLQFILNLIAGIYPSESNPHLVYLKGEEYDSSKEKILMRLSKGDKLFVISVYQTIGAGQNLQYTIPSSLQGNLIRSNTYPPRNEKDFDAIYLDKPTNLFVNMETNWQEENFVKYLFQVEFLQENSELSMTDALKHIRKAFRCYMTGEMSYDYVESVYQKQSLMMFATRTVIQAIGRICRTNQKKPHIYIFADERLADFLDLSVTNGRILNHEFLELVHQLRQTQHKQPIPGSLEDKGNLVSNRAGRDIDSLLQEEWNEKRIAKWQKLRELVLCYPTASDAQAEQNFIIQNYYIHLPQKSNILYYSQEEDYRHINISFVQTQLYHSIENEANTRLDRLMLWPALRQEFEANGFATAFEPNDYILSPPLWNNIYKGALGEVAGRFWFKHVLGITLEDISDPTQFELFDFKVSGKPIFVDFKNWDESTNTDRNAEIEKIQRKAEKCGCKCVIIANVLSSHIYKNQKGKKGETAFLIISSLLVHDGSIQINEKAATDIRRCLDAYPSENKST